MSERVQKQNDPAETQRRGENESLWGLDKPFSNGQWHINASTVGELVDELSRLPRDLHAKQGFADSIDIVVFNRDGEDGSPFVEFCDGGEWTDDETEKEEVAD